MQCKALSAIMYFISLHVLSWVLYIISLYGALSLHNSAHLEVHVSLHVRWNNRRYCGLKTITIIYYINYNFIYSNTTVTVTYMYIKHYLSEPFVRCSSHTSLPSICLHSGVKCGAFSHQPV